MATPIARPAPMAAMRAALARSPAVALPGPRQVGKTTLARRFVPPGSSPCLDLEDPTVLAPPASPMTLPGSASPRLLRPGSASLAGRPA